MGGAASSPIELPRGAPCPHWGAPRRTQLPFLGLGGREGRSWLMFNNSMEAAADFGKSCKILPESVEGKFWFQGSLPSVL